MKQLPYPSVMNIVDAHHLSLPVFFNCWKFEKLKKYQLSTIGIILYSSEFTMVYPKTPFVVWVTKG